VPNKLNITPWRQMGEWRYSSTILDPAIRWWAVSFTSQPLFSGERAPGTHLIWGWMGPEPIWTLRSRGSAFGIAIDYGHDGRGVGVRVPSGAKIFLLSASSRPILRSTHPPIQWVPEALHPAESGWDVKLTTHLQLEPRSRIRGFIHPLPHTSSQQCLNS
jgi:hypothetical protein